MEPQQENIVPNEFDPIEFWEKNKQRILLFGFLLVAGLAAFVIYQISTHRSLGESQAMLERAEGIEDYRELISTYPRSMAAANAHLLLAKELRQEGNHDEALSVLRELTGQFPEHPLAAAAWLSMAQTLEATGDTEKAVQTYQTVIARYPDSYGAPMAQSNYAALLKSQGKTDEARQAYETLMSQYPESYYARQAQQELQFLR